MSNIIELLGVDLYYDKGAPTETHALQSIELSVPAGEFVGLFGPSGCGKSSILYAISGIELPTSGTIFSDNKNLRDLSADELAIYRQTSVGIIFQNFNLIPSINILDNVMLPMAMLGVGRAARKEKAFKILERLGMEQFAKRFAHELSGGQQQRVGIARALANDPPVVLADEPVGSLDSVNANKVLDFLKELNEKDKRTIILVTHEAWSLRDARQIHYMKDGKIVKSEKAGGTGVVEATAPDQLPAAVKAYRHVYPDYADATINAKALASLFLRGYRAEEVARFELFLEDLLKEKISPERFQELLDLPWRDGGMGFWKQRAAHISEVVGGAVAERRHLASIYAELEQDVEEPLMEEVHRLTQWLERSSHYRFDRTLYRRFSDAVKRRLHHDDTSADFVAFLNKSVAEQGMGIRIERARALATNMDEVLG